MCNESVYLPAWSWQSLLTPKGVCNQEGEPVILLTSLDFYRRFCVCVCVCVSTCEWQLLQVVSLAFIVRVEGRPPSNLGQHLNQTSNPNPSPAGLTAQEANLCVAVCGFVFPLCLYVCLTSSSTSVCITHTHTPLGTTLPIWTTIHHFHIVALMRDGLIIHVQGDKIRGREN